MAEVLDCSPCYEGTPNIVPGAPSALPIEALARSRLFTGGTFFRSKLAVTGDSDFQGTICNSIALAVVQAGTAFDLIVYFEDIEVERYSTTQDATCPTLGGGVAIPDLRSQTASSTYISMPVRGTDEQDPGGIDDLCLTFFAKVNMLGGAGPSENDLTSIRTGPERSIAYISSKENSSGKPVNAKSLIQWNYDTLQWVSYVLDADCAIPSERCP